MTEENKIPQPYLDAIEYIKQSSPQSSVYIGCDSIRYKKGKKRAKGRQWYAKYSTVIIIHIDSKHGGKVFHHTVSEPDYGNLKTRLLTEVQMAVEAALAVVDVIGDRHMEVHLDLNGSPSHKSNVALKEAVGWVQGMGFEPVIKPEAFAACHAADHCVRNTHVM